MSVSQPYIIDDIHNNIHKLFVKLVGNTSPWTRWAVYRGFPDIDVLDSFDKPVIYIMQPNLINTTQQQGGIGRGQYSVIIGWWDDRKTGGPKEVGIITSQMIYLFKYPIALHAITYDITVRGTTTTGTTLSAQKLSVEGITNIRPIATEDKNEFRSECEITLSA